MKAGTPTGDRILVVHMHPETDILPMLKKVLGRIKNAQVFLREQQPLRLYIYHDEILKLQTIDHNCQQSKEVSLTELVEWIT